MCICLSLMSPEVGGPFRRIEGALPRDQGPRTQAGGSVGGSAKSQHVDSIFGSSVAATFVTIS